MLLLESKCTIGEVHGLGPTPQFNEKTPDIATKGEVWSGHFGRFGRRAVRRHHKSLKHLGTKKNRKHQTPWPTVVSNLSLSLNRSDLFRPIWPEAEAALA